MVVFALNSGGSLGALSHPDLGASACLLSDVATLALWSGGCGSEASQLLVSTVVLSLSAKSDKSDDEELFKHCVIQIFLLLL